MGLFLGGGSARRRGIACPASRLFLSTSGALWAPFRVQWGYSRGGKDTRGRDEKGGTRGREGERGTRGREGEGGGGREQGGGRGREGTREGWCAAAGVYEGEEERVQQGREEEGQVVVAAARGGGGAVAASVWPCERR